MLVLIFNFWKSFRPRSARIQTDSQDGGLINRNPSSYRKRKSSFLATILDDDSTDSGYGDVRTSGSQNSRRSRHLIDRMLDGTLEPSQDLHAGLS